MSSSNPIGPLAQYRARIERGELIPDPRQEALAGILEERYRQLLQPPRRWWEAWRPRRSPVRGLYLHGRVGRGKTMLMDLLASSLDQAGVPVWRIHFHRFMTHVHDRLAELDRQRNPLEKVAAAIAARARVLCFDEFHVDDIGDAMILGELIQQLAERDVVLVATSNTEPKNLYADGLQRARFLPAIELIEKNCDVMSLDAREDYRLRELSRHPVYRWPADEFAQQELEREFRTLAAGEAVSTAALKVRNRSLQPLRRAGSLAWFEFSTLCDGPRASADYIELARRFSTLMISNVRQMDDSDNDAARRFIHLVDECYDRAVKLIVIAEASPEALYLGRRLAAPFERTVSRLIEMQSHDYLARPHQP